MKKSLYFKNIIFIALIILFSLVLFSCDSREDGARLINESKEASGEEVLMKKEFLDDFDYAFKTLEEYYPYFDINKELHNVDWLSMEEEFRNIIKDCSSDYEFKIKMFKILDLLNNAHTKLITESDGLGYYILYKNTLPEGDWRNEMSSIYERAEVRKRYDIGESKVEYMLEKFKNREIGYDSSLENVHVKDIIDGELAYIKIGQMIDDNFLNNDKKIINPYLEKIKDYPALVIDIRGNGGGDSSYWYNYLLPSIVDKEYGQKSYLFIKEGELLEPIYSQEEYKTLTDSDMENFNFPDKTIKYLEGFDLYSELVIKVEPNEESIKFKGNIYLLVDEEVYSSSEMMASFCKESGLATLLGTRTKGDGIGSDPIQFSLPNTGFVIRFTKEMGVTEKGIINELEQTLPDILVEDMDMSVDIKNQEIIKKILDIENIREK